MEKKQMSLALSTKKEDDISKWYEEVCIKGELADFSTVKGCMVIKPNGYAVWQAIQVYFNRNIVEKTGARNAYFPLFIPESFFSRESEHAEGFNPEVAWIDRDVTGDGERLAVRPTSETIIYDSYSSWVRSYRDLPLRINQWANVVRWETNATKLFMRSREFLWQEGHCVYETEEECDRETEMYINLYKDLCEELLCLPVLVGRKTDKEKFAGAKYTLTIEAFMPDGKALQCGTSHNLGTGFAKAFGIKFVGRDEKQHLPWQNSWGLSTRLIGGTVMTHSDDRGLVLPPKVAETQIVIIPILFEKTKEDVLKACRELKQKLSSKYRVLLDDRDGYSPGWKFNEWEMKGVPLRIELGPKDLEKSQAVIVRRDDSSKKSIRIPEISKAVQDSFSRMELDMFSKAKKFLDSKIVETADWNEFVDAIDKKKVVRTIFCGESECEEIIKDKTGGASSRCIPLGSRKPDGGCVHCGKHAQVEIFFSKSY